MPAIQNLKKQLRGIKSTQKLTKAMRTVATVKFSKLNGIYSDYSDFGNACEKMHLGYKTEFSKSLPKCNPDAPVLVIVIASNKGLCGSFNSELLSFAKEQLDNYPKFDVIPCGKKAVTWFAEKKIQTVGEYVLNDIPSFEDSAEITDDIFARITAGEVSSVKVIYPKYTNMMKQAPVVVDLLSDTGDDSVSGGLLYFPDKDTVISGTVLTVFRSFVYKILLETALGAQASTLMTMRSAYDTATEYAEKLEGQINRLRQSAVTSDVIETASAFEE